MIKWDSFMCFMFPGRGGTLSMASRTGFCPVTAGSGVMSQGWSTSLWVTSSCPLRTGSGRRTGTWMKTLEESPQRKRSVLRSLKPQKELSLALSRIWYSVCFQGWTYAIDFPATYTERQKMELLRSSSQMDTIQKVQGTGHLGQGVYQHKGLESNYTVYLILIVSH